MCGIVGYISFQGERLAEEAIPAFMDPLKFRGPDHQAHKRIEEGDIALFFGHTRLSIIDLSPDGNQPKESPSGRSWVTFNGEIYNFQELKKELVELGHTFYSKSDTEVILVGYEAWGMEKLVKKMDGMFALGLYDRQEKKLFLARDRFGKKPMYYHWDAAHKSLTFGSDIRSFDGLKKNWTLNLRALGYYFAELSTPMQESIWNEIQKLPPASYAEVSPSGIEVHSYWDLDYSQKLSLPREEILAETDRLLAQAVIKRKVADVNVCSFLSGGIDSSLVAALLAVHSDKPIDTFSIGFSEQKFNELPYAKAVADKYGTKHHEIILQPDDFSIVEQLIEEFGEPFADSSMIPTYYVSKAVSNTEKVALSGDGGDEIFGGYYVYHFANDIDQMGAWAPLEPVAKGLATLTKNQRFAFLASVFAAKKKDKVELLNRHMGFSDQELASLLGQPQFFEARRSEHGRLWQQYGAAYPKVIDQVLATSLRTRLVNDYLVKVDRSSMFSSLEVRSPFLDKDLAAFAAQIPGDQLIHKRISKSILKDLARKYLPHELIDRPKQGFAIPVGEWFKKELKEEIREVILGGKQKMIDLNYEFIEELIGQHQLGEKEHPHKIWALYVFHKWAQKR